MSSFSFNHIALSVQDVTESVEFYQNVLQLEEIDNTASESKTRWLSLNEGKQLHLIPRPNALIKVNKAVHFALSTSDMDSVIANLKELRIDFYDWLENLNKVYIRKDGIKQIIFKTQMAIGLK